MNFVTAARIEDIPKGGCRQFEIERRQILICELGGQYYALSAICPHKGGPLGAVPPAGGYLFCPLHGWQFDLRTGACLNRPDKPVPTCPLRVENGQIQIAVSHL